MVLVALKYRSNLKYIVSSSHHLPVSNAALKNIINANEQRKMGMHNYAIDSIEYMRIENKVSTACPSASYSAWPALDAP